MQRKNRTSGRLPTQHASAHEVLLRLFITTVGHLSPSDALCYLRDPAHFVKPKSVAPADYGRSRAAFSYLLAKQYIEFQMQQGIVTIHLTPAGERRADSKLLSMRLDGRLRQPPGTWDGKWRLILFDIPAQERVKRNAFRTMLRRLGAVMLQKSVWIYPHDCTQEAALLARWLDLSGEQMRVVLAENIGEDRALINRFRLQRS